MPNIEFIKFSKLFNWDVKQFVESSQLFTNYFPIVPFKEFAKPASLKSIKIQDGETYKILGVRSYGLGAYVNREVEGKTLKMKVYQQVKPNHLYWCKVDTKNGAFGIITDDIADGVASSNMTLAELDTTKINPEFLQLFFRSKKFNAYMDSFVTGTTNRKYIRPNQILEEIKIPLPPLDDEDAKKRNLSNAVTQEKLVTAYNQKIAEAEAAKIKAKQKEVEIEKYLLSKLGISNSEENLLKVGLKFVKFKDLNEWGATKLNSNSILFSDIYPNIPLSQIAEINPTTSFNKLSASMNVAFLPMANISDIEGEVKYYSEGKVSNAKGYTKFIDGDLLWARITPCMENGKSAIVKNMENGYGYGSTEYHIIRTDDEILTKYIHLLLRYEKILQAAKTHFTGSAGQQRVPKSFLANLEIPLPDKSVQEEIVTNVSNLKKEIKEMRNQSNLSKVQALLDFEHQIFKRN